MPLSTGEPREGEPEGPALFPPVLRSDARQTRCAECIAILALPRASSCSSQMPWRRPEARTISRRQTQSSTASEALKTSGEPTALESSAQTLAMVTGWDLSSPSVALPKRERARLHSSKRAVAQLDALAGSGAAAKAASTSSSSSAGSSSSSSRSKPSRKPRGVVALDLGGSAGAGAGGAREPPASSFDSRSAFVSILSKLNLAPRPVEGRRSESINSASEYLRSLARERMFALMRKGKMLSSSSSSSFDSIFSISTSALRAAAATAADSVLVLGTVGRFGFGVGAAGCKAEAEAGGSQEGEMPCGSVSVGSSASSGGSISSSSAAWAIASRYFFVAVIFLVQSFVASPGSPS